MSGVQSYDFLFDDQGDDRVERLTMLQEFMGSLSELKGTWTLKDMPVDGRQFSNLPDDFYHFVGTWKQPSHYSGVERSARWVNPAWPHAWQYSDCAVECRCSGIILRDGNQTVDSPEFGHQPEGCTTEDRLRVNEELFNRRVNIVVRAANCWQTAEEVAPRLGYFDAHSVLRLCDRIGIDWVELRKRGRERMIETWDQLRDRGYTYPELAVAFDVPDSTIRNYVNRTGRGL